MSRPRLILAALAFGLAAGALAWWAAASMAPETARLDDLQARAERLRPPKQAAGRVARADAARVASQPLLVLTAGPGAVTPPVLRLDGVSRSRGRLAALVSVNDGPSAWLAAGESRDGVTLLSVSGGEAVFDTVLGPQTVALGERSPGASAAAVAGAAASNVTGPDQLPPGVRGPPPPASAPGMR